MSAEAESSVQRSVVAKTTSSNAGRKRRSCHMCSRRKVKCDKQKPCQSCVKAGIECVFPDITPGRAQTGMPSELVEMLQRLEKVVETLEPKEQQRIGSMLPSHHDLDTEQNSERRLPKFSGPTTLEEDRPINMGIEPPGPVDGDMDENLNLSPELHMAKAPSTDLSQEESPGKIVRDHGRETYVRRWFWEDDGSEISSGSVTSDDYSDVEEIQNSVAKTSSFAPTSQNPAPKSKISQILNSQRRQLWRIFKERVQPLTKLLHLPSFEQNMAQPNSPMPDDGTQCILLAVYYGAVTSLSEEECVTIFAYGQTQVLSVLREDLQVMFSSAMLLHTGNVQPLQALTLYLIFLRHHEPRLSWNLTGVAVRLAQSFGLHRNSSLFGLSNFEMEMRRRLWWQIAILDAPSAEDYSGEYNLLELSSTDTQLPQNLEDTQLDPVMMESPPETRGITEMTLTIARCYITNMYRCMVDTRRQCGNTRKSYIDLTAHEKSNWIDACEATFSERFLGSFSSTNPFHWVTFTFTRMLFHKVRLHGCNPLQDPGAASEATRERLFPIAVEVMELNYKLRTDPRTRPWLWLFSSYTQWQAFSLVLVWLQMDPLGKNSRRAWEAVEKAVVLRWEHPRSLLNGRKPQQWRSIIRLLEKARSAHQKAMSSNRARRASRHVKPSRHPRVETSVSTTDGSDIGKPSNTKDQQVQENPWTKIQRQGSTAASRTGPIGPSTSLASLAHAPMMGEDVDPTPDAGHLQDDTTMPDFSIEAIDDLLFESDLGFSSGYSAGDFQFEGDLAFLNDMK